MQKVQLASQEQQGANEERSNVHNPLKTANWPTALPSISHPREVAQAMSRYQNQNKILVTLRRSD